MSYKPKESFASSSWLHEDLIPPDTLDGVENKEKEPWRTEYDVVSTLRGMGHEVRPIGVRSELGVIREAIEEHKPARGTSTCLKSSTAIRSLTSTWSAIWN